MLLQKWQRKFQAQRLRKYFLQTCNRQIHRQQRNQAQEKRRMKNIGDTKSFQYAGSLFTKLLYNLVSPHLGFLWAPCTNKHYKGRNQKQDDGKPYRSDKAPKSRFRKRL